MKLNEKSILFLLSANVEGDFHIKENLQLLKYSRYSSWERHSLKHSHQFSMLYDKTLNAIKILFKPQCCVCYSFHIFSKMFV